MKRLITLIILTFYGLGLNSAAQAATGERVRITGEIVDTWCYISEIMGGGEAITGSAHHQCAIWCAAGGIPVGLLAETGELYMVLKLGDDDRSNANPRILEIQSNKVVVEGDVIERDGIRYILIDDIVENAGIVNRSHDDYGVIPEFGCARTMMITRKIRTLTMATMFLAAASTSGSAAESWNVAWRRESPVRWPRWWMCYVRLTGDCPQSCGEGRRQLGLLTADNKLILPTKNASAFTGATDDLIEFCGQQVMADGIFTENYGLRVFAVQFVKPVDGKWQRTNRYLDKWAMENGVDPTGNAKKSWFRKDPRIRALIEKDGFLGLGLDEDKAFLEENY